MAKKSDSPKCFGKFKCGNCEYIESCKFVTQSDKRFRTDDVHFEIENMEFNPKVFDKHNQDEKDLTDAIDQNPDNLEDKVFTFTNKNGSKLEVDLSYLPEEFILAWTMFVIEHPKSAKAYVLKCFGGCKNLAQVAEHIGYSRQRLYSGVTKELKVAKRKIPEAKILKNCTHDEKDIYTCIHIDKMSQRDTAERLGISRTKVQRCIRKLRLKDIKVYPPSRAKNKKVAK